MRAVGMSPRSSWPRPWPWPSPRCPLDAGRQALPGDPPDVTAPRARGRRHRWRHEPLPTCRRSRSPSAARPGRGTPARTEPGGGPVDRPAGTAGRGHGHDGRRAGPDHTRCPTSRTGTRADERREESRRCHRQTGPTARTGHRRCRRTRAGGRPLTSTARRSRTGTVPTSAGRPARSRATSRRRRTRSTRARRGGVPGRREAVGRSRTCRPRPRRRGPAHTPGTARGADVERRTIHG